MGRLTIRIITINIYKITRKTHVIMSSSPHEDTWSVFHLTIIRKYLFHKKHRLPHSWCKKVYFLLYSFRSISNEIGWFINKKLLISDYVQKIPSIFIFRKTLLRDESDMTNDDVRVNQGFRKIRLLHFRIKAAWIWDLVEIFQRGSFLIQTVKATTYKPHDLIMKSSMSKHTQHHHHHQ